MRATALAALRRLELLGTKTALKGLADAAAVVRRRTCEEVARVHTWPSSGPASSAGRRAASYDQPGAGRRPGSYHQAGAGAGAGSGATSPPSEVVAAVVAALSDQEPFVVEAAAFSLGELLAAERPPARTPPAGTPVPPAPDASAAIAALAATSRDHTDPLCREAAVAAIGSIGDDRGLEAILVATKDKPAVRRRAVVALAPFEGPEVDAALSRALKDRDWQVRQAAEDIAGPLEEPDQT